MYLFPYKNSSNNNNNNLICSVLWCLITINILKCSSESFGRSCRLPFGLLRISSNGPDRFTHSNDVFMHSALVAHVHRTMSGGWWCYNTGDVEQHQHQSNDSTWQCQCIRINIVVLYMKEKYQECQKRF